jgi:isochorismate hydrolase
MKAVSPFNNTISQIGEIPYAHERRNIVEAIEEFSFPQKKNLPDNSTRCVIYPRTNVVKICQKSISFIKYTPARLRSLNTIRITLHGIAEQHDRDKYWIAVSVQ